LLATLAAVYLIISISLAKIEDGLKEGTDFLTAFVRFLNFKSKDNFKNNLDLFSSTIFLGSAEEII